MISLAKSIHKSHRPVKIIQNSSTLVEIFSQLFVIKGANMVYLFILASSLQPRRFKTFKIHFKHELTLH